MAVHGRAPDEHLGVGYFAYLGSALRLFWHLPYHQNTRTPSMCPGTRTENPKLPADRTYFWVQMSWCQRPSCPSFLEPVFSDVLIFEFPTRPTSGSKVVTAGAHFIYVSTVPNRISYWTHHGSQLTSDIKSQWVNLDIRFCERWAHLVPRTSNYGVCSRRCHSCLVIIPCDG